jgi:hypothetical protein
MVTQERAGRKEGRVRVEGRVVGWRRVVELDSQQLSDDGFQGIPAGVRRMTLLKQTTTEVDP